MSATMARQGGQVQLEQSDMHLALDVTKMAKRVYLHAAIEETQYLTKKPLVKVCKEKKRGVIIPGPKNVKAGLEWHQAIVRETPTDGCLSCQNGTAQNLQTLRWRKGTCAPPPDQLIQLWPELTPFRPGTPCVPPSDAESAHDSDIEGVPPGYVYIHTPLPSAQCVNLDIYSEDCKHNKHYIPDLLTDEGIFTG